MAYLFDPGIASVQTSAGAFGVGWKLNWYAAGTTTRVDTFTDADLADENANPVIADASGRFPAIWLEPGSYKFVLTDAADVVKVTRDEFEVAEEPIDTAAALDDFLAGTDPLPVASGGTGSTTAADARTALGALGTAGGTVTGDIARSGLGDYLYHAAANMGSGRVFLTASAASDPTSLAGDIWLKY